MDQDGHELFNNDFKNVKIPDTIMVWSADLDWCTRVVL